MWWTPWLWSFRTSGSSHAGGENQAAAAHVVNSEMRARGLALAALATLFLLGVLAPAAHAAVSITRAELSGGNLRVEGSGALPNAQVTVNGGAASANADGSGQFRIERSGFTAPA